MRWLLRGACSAVMVCAVCGAAITSSDLVRGGSPWLGFSLSVLALVVGAIVAFVWLLTEPEV